MRNCFPGEALWCRDIDHIRQGTGVTTTVQWFASTCKPGEGKLSAETDGQKRKGVPEMDVFGDHGPT
jgi:hypothetical protein